MLEPSSLNWKDGGCYDSKCDYIQHMWNEKEFNVNVDDSISEETKYGFYDSTPACHNYFIEACHVEHISVKMTVGRTDGDLMLGLLRFVLSLQCAGRSICST